MATTSHEYRFRDGRVVTVTHDDNTLTYRLDGQLVTDPAHIAALITEFRRTG